VKQRAGSTASYFRRVPPRRSLVIRHEGCACREQYKPTTSRGACVRAPVYRNSRRRGQWRRGGDGGRQPSGGNHRYTIYIYIYVCICIYTSNVICDGDDEARSAPYRYASSTSSEFEYETHFATSIILYIYMNSHP